MRTLYLLFTLTCTLAIGAQAPQGESMRKKLLEKHLKGKVTFDSTFSFDDLTWVSPGLSNLQTMLLIHQLKQSTAQDASQKVSEELALITISKIYADWSDRNKSKELEEFLRNNSNFTPESIDEASRNDKLLQTITSLKAMMQDIELSKNALAHLATNLDDLPLLDRWTLLERLKDGVVCAPDQTKFITDAHAYAALEKQKEVIKYQQVYEQYLNNLVKNEQYDLIACFSSELDEEQRKQLVATLKKKTNDFQQTITEELFEIARASVRPALVQHPDTVQEPSEITLTPLSQTERKELLEELLIPRIHQDSEVEIREFVMLTSGLNKLQLLLFIRIAVIRLIDKNKLMLQDYLKIAQLAAKSQRNLLLTSPLSSPLECESKEVWVPNDLIQQLFIKTADAKVRKQQELIKTLAPNLELKGYTSLEIASRLRDCTPKELFLILQECQQSLSPNEAEVSHECLRKAIDRSQEKTDYQRKLGRYVTHIVMQTNWYGFQSEQYSCFLPKMADYEIRCLLMQLQQKTCSRRWQQDPLTYHEFCEAYWKLCSKQDQPSYERNDIIKMFLGSYGYGSSPTALKSLLKDHPNTPALQQREKVLEVIFDGTLFATLTLREIAILTKDFSLPQLYYFSRNFENAIKRNLTIPDYNILNQIRYCKSVNVDWVALDRSNGHTKWYEQRCREYEYKRTQRINIYRLKSLYYKLHLDDSYTRKKLTKTLLLLAASAGIVAY